MHHYAGIGSRATPPDVQAQMSALARSLAESGWILRSGGAQGADKAFEAGARLAGGQMEIYRPEHADRSTFAGRWAHDMAAAHHPAWFALRSPYVRALMARNTFQVLGDGCDEPVSRFVACWTPDGATASTSRETGGTGQAIRIAAAHGVAVFNLANRYALEQLQEFVAALGVSTAAPELDAEQSESDGMRI